MMSFVTSTAVLAPEPPAHGAPQGALALLHGLGMDPAVLRPFLRSLALPTWSLVPEGPVDTGAGTRAWWAVDPAKRQARMAAGPSDLFDRHPAGRPRAHAALDDALSCLRQVAPGLPLIVAGFSQGGMLAVDHALRGRGRPPSALALLSSSCIALDEWAPHWRRLAGMPVLLAHGRDDDDLAFSAGERLRDQLHAAGAQVRWLPFEGGHELPLVVWRALRRFVADVAAGNPALGDSAEFPLAATLHLGDGFADKPTKALNPPQALP